ncbi:uncharacterized protein LOC125727711 [Brienomyrus brachyistius]|uniref:uncharacterized protein LOC125727711 n=1 Tax=Brienomyrus brachyistius TaxID=42636 RepID=UPI0020B1B25B|nr:uncharacterized protein LOC125727711 [Brienomyrus brachyistius]
MINDLRNLLATTSFPYPMTNTIEVTGVNLTTAPKTELDYDIDMEVTVSDIAMINDLRNLLATTSFPYPMSNTIEVTGVNLTTVCYPNVCYPNGNGFQCRCEERFALSYDSCVLYTHCDDIIQGTCRCINAIPADGQFCQPQLPPKTELDYDIDIEVTVSDIAMINDLRNLLATTSFPYPMTNAIEVTGVNLTTVCYPNGNGFQCRCDERFALSYDSCVLYTHCDDIIQGTCRCINAIPADGQFCQPQLPPKTELDYDIDIEVTVSDIAMINDLRNLLATTSFPYPMSNTIEVTGVNLTTVCYPNGNGFQCRCDERFALSYDSCVLYTHCDDIIQGTCRCINAIPADGQFCQPQLPPKTELDYDIDIEVTVSDIAMINDLRNLLATTSFPYPMTNAIEVTGVNLTTGKSNRLGIFSSAFLSRYLTEIFIYAVTLEESYSSSCIYQ